MVVQRRRMKRILVIEDDDLLRGLLKTMLSREGFQVVEARHGAEGIKRYDAQRFELVLTDILMPEQEGLQTIRELRERNPDIAIIAMSGGGRQVELDVLDVAQRFGATATIGKPFDVADVLELVRSLLKEKPGQRG